MIHPDPAPTDANPSTKRRVRCAAPLLLAALIHDRPLPTPERRHPEKPLAELTKDQRKQRLKQTKAAEATRKAQEAAAAQAVLDDRAAERIAPAAQRKPVLGPDGSVLYHPKLERDGIGFIQSSPLVHAAIRGQKRIDAGLRPTVTAEHIQAVAPILSAWRTPRPCRTPGSARG